MTEDDSEWAVGDLSMTMIYTQVQAEALAAKAVAEAEVAAQQVYQELSEEEKERIWNLVVQTCR